MAVSAVFVSLGLAYFFRWGPWVRHDPSVWLLPGDLLNTYAATRAFAHGHFGAIYGSGFLALPGFLVLVAPFGAMSDIFPHPQALVFVAPYVLVLSCGAIVACDAMAARLGVPTTRRVVLSVVEGVLLWNVVVLWGHPEDAVAVGLTLYAVINAFEGRWSRVGWLLGAALAVQPLVVVVLPILLGMAGRKWAMGMIIRTLIPATVVTLPPLIANFHATVYAIVGQPTSPYFNHETPWVFLATKLGGQGPSAMVGAGPTRLVAVALAVVLGWWSRHWREKPEVLLGAMAVCLALRCYTEVVMASYYVWAALAVGVVVAARRNAWCFTVAVIAAVGTTVTAQWSLGEYAWWTTDIVGLTVVLVAACAPTPGRRLLSLRVSVPRST